MTLAEEYQRQQTWRNWEAYLQELPLRREQTVLDIGCSLGYVSNLLAGKVKRVIGIDNNPDLLEEAEKNRAANVTLVSRDLSTMPPLTDEVKMSLEYFEEVSLREEKYDFQMGAKSR